MIIGVLTTAVLLGLIPAIIAYGKGRSFFSWWAYGALLLIVALPHALLLRTSQEGLDRRGIGEGMRKCPYCAELIRPDAIVCRYCGRNLPRKDMLSVRSSQVASPLATPGAPRFSPIQQHGIGTVNGVQVPGVAIGLNRRLDLIRFYPDTEPDHSDGRTYDIPLTSFQ